MRLSTTFLIGLLLAVSGFTALAEEAPVNLCTAEPDGNYFAAGRDIAAHANPQYVKVAVVETSGSMDNMQRMARGECGAAIVQSDAYLVYQARHKNAPVEIIRNQFLYAEFIQLICRRDAEIATTEDLLASPGRHTVLVGNEQSGSALTWHAFTLLDRRYAALSVEQIGGESALDRVVGGNAQCLFFVSGLGSKFSRNVNQRGKDLRLVPLTEDVLRGAKFGASKLYESRRIPKGTYANLEAGLSASGVETLTVGATFVIDRHWSDRHANGPAALLGAVAGATPAIQQRALSVLK